MKNKKIILEQTPNYSQQEVSKLKLANEKGCYPSWLKNGQIGNYNGKKCWYGTNDKGNTTVFYADMTAETIKKDGTTVKGKWSCQAITQTAGVEQTTTKLSPDQQSMVETMINDQGWSKTKPEDYDVYPTKYDIYTKIPGYTLYKPVALKNVAPEQLSSIKSVLNEKGYTLTQPTYGTPEWRQSASNPMTLGNVMSQDEANSLGVKDLTINIYPSTAGPKDKETVKTEIEAVKSAKRYSKQECQFAIENLYNNSELVTKKPRNFTPLTDLIDIQSTKTTAVACIAQQGVDGFTVMRGYGFKTEEKLKQLIRDTGKFGLKQLFDSYKKDLRTTQRESVETKDLKKVIRENISKINKSKTASLLQEGKIINNRFNIITEGIKPKNKKDQKKIGKELFSEMMYLNKQGYSQELISEGLMDIFSSIFPKGVSEPIMQYFKEEAAKWLADKFGLDSNSWMSSIIISAIGNLNIGDISKLTDCNFVTKLLSKSIAEGVLRKIQTEKFGDSAFYNLIRNTMVDSLVSTDLGTKLEEKLGSLICPMVSSLSGKMEGAADMMKQKALGAV